MWGNVFGQPRLAVWPNSMYVIVTCTSSGLPCWLSDSFWGSRYALVQQHGLHCIHTRVALVNGEGDGSGAITCKTSSDRSTGELGKRSLPWVCHASAADHQQVSHSEAVSAPPCCKGCLFHRLLTHDAEHSAS